MTIQDVLKPGFSLRTVYDVAKEKDVHEETIRDHIRRGKIEAIQLGKKFYVVVERVAE